MGNGKWKCAIIMQNNYCTHLQPKDNCFQMVCHIVQPSRHTQGIEDWTETETFVEEPKLANHFVAGIGYMFGKLNALDF